MNWNLAVVKYTHLLEAMDPISVAIIVTVLSFGTLLVYLFRNDYQSRRRRNESQTTKQGTAHAKPQTSSIKQHVKSSIHSNTNKKNSDQANQASGDAVALKQILSDIDDLVELPIDEIDSSDSVRSNNAKTDECTRKKILPIKFDKKIEQSQQIRAEKGNKNHRQVRQVSGADEPSSEQLLKLIAVCNLSKDEIELAVEHLLEKSSNPEWKPSKSDPLNKVKNQLEQTRLELTKQQMLLQNRNNQLHKCELSNKELLETVRNLEVKLKNENDEKMSLLHGYEVHSKKIGDQIKEFEEKLHSSEVEANNMRSALDNLHKRLKEVLDANGMLEKSLNDLQLINARQEEMLIRLREERLVNEASMKRTLVEMEEELRELQGKLSANSASQEDVLKRELDQVEREQKLKAELRELREGLSALLPDIKSNDTQVENGNWVHHYLSAVQHLAKTVEELRQVNNNNDIIYPDSPTKQLIDKSTLTPIYKNGRTSRVNSPTNNGRASKTGSHKLDYDNDKKAMETKLLELSDYVIELEAEVQSLSAQKVENANFLIKQQQQHEKKIKELNLLKSKLEAQIKFGLDSLKMEQKRAKNLEIRLANFGAEGTFETSAFVSDASH